MTQPSDPVNPAVALGAASVPGIAAVAKRAAHLAEQALRVQRGEEQQATGPFPLDDELDQWTEEAMVGDDGEYRSPGGEADVDKLLRVLRHLARREADVEATRAGRVEEINTWAAARTEDVAKRRGAIEARIEGWARAQLEASGGKTITWKLPAGTVSLPKARTKVHVLDAKVSPQMLVDAGFSVLTSLKEERTVSKSAIADAAKAQGYGPEIDGTVAFPPEPGYTVHHVPAPGTDPADGVFLPGVGLLVPVQERNLKVTPGA